MKYREARTVGERALVVWVDRKQLPDELASKDRIPDVFRARIGRRTHSYQIDVQPVARGAKHGPARRLRPGKRVTVQVADERGSLSAYVEPLAGGRALISGHVGIRKGNPVTALLPDGSSIDLGVVDKIQNDALVDAALILNAPVSEIDALALSAAAIRDLSAGEIGLLIRVMRPDGVVDAAVDAIDAPADFGSDGSMDGLIRLDRRVTDPGDSGSPVVDREGNVLGFVVGGATVVDDDDGTARSHTFVLTSRRALDVVNSP
jgi:S1-C subfamily serine protease